MNMQQLFNAGAFSAVKRVLRGMLTMTAAMGIAMASDRAIEKLPSDQRLFYTPEERGARSAELDSAESPEPALVTVIDLRSRTQALALQRSAETHEKEDRATRAFELRFSAFVSTNTSYQLLINNLPCHLLNIDLKGPIERTRPVVCPHLLESAYRLEFQTVTRKLFVHHEGEQPRQLNVGQRLSWR